MKRLPWGARDPRFAHACALICVGFTTIALASACDGVDPAFTPEDGEDTVEDTADPTFGTGGTDVDTPDVCAGEACLECAPAETVCDGACVDTSDDPANCGACGTACSAGESCESGACVVECSAGTVACGGSCVDVATDVGHCGGCGASCGSGETCFEGGCTAACAPSEARCDGACVDVSTSFADCGACGVACGDGSACSAGACACLSGFGDCDGAAATGCETDLQASATHCGACGVSCFCDAGDVDFEQVTPGAGDVSAHVGAIDFETACGVAPTAWRELDGFAVFSNVEGTKAGRVIATTPLRAQWMPEHGFVAGERVRAVLTSGVEALDGTAATGFGWAFQVAATAGEADLEMEELAAGFGQLAVATGDFGKDGWVDFVTCGRNGGLHVFNGGPDGFVHETVGVVTGQCLDVDAADVDGDGWTDFVVGGSAHYFRYREGVWELSETPVFAQGHGSVVGDFDNDGDVDVIRFGTDAPPTYHVNVGDGAFESAGVPFGFTAEWFDFQAADLDGDGDLDLVGSTFDGTAAVPFFYAEGAFTNATEQTFATGECYRFDLGDVDGDGDVDAFFADYANGVQVWTNDGSGVFEQHQVAQGRPGAVGARLGDLDADGDLDAYTTHWMGMSEQVWVNQGAGIFTGAAAVDVGSKGMGVEIVDLDRDGALDVVVVGDEGAVPVRVWRNR